MRCLLVCVALSWAVSTGQLLRGVGVAGGGAVSQIALVSSTACSSNSGTSYACTIPSTTAGDALIIIQADEDNPAAPGVPTGVTGSTCVTDKSYAQNNNEGRQTFFSCPTINAGITSVTLNVAATGHSSVNIREYKGMKATALLDAVAAAKTITTATTVEFSNTIQATQTDLAVAYCATGGSAAANMSARTGWANGKDFPNAADVTDVFAVDIVNAKATQITALLNGDSHNYSCAIAAYKSAVVETVPTGNLPSAYLDFETGVNGDQIVPGNALTSAHGGNCTWTVQGGSSANLVIDTALDKPLLTQISVNGVSFAPPNAGTRGIHKDPITGGQFLQCAWSGGSTTTASIGVWWHSSAATDSQTYSMFGIGGGGDVATVSIAGAVNPSHLIIEANSGDSTGFVTIATNTWYMVTLQYVSNGTHSMNVYDTSGAQIGSTVTVAATGINPPVTAFLGQTHAGAGTSANNWGWDNWQIDYLNGTFPLKQ